MRAHWLFSRAFRLFASSARFSTVVKRVSWESITLPARLTSLTHALATLGLPIILLETSPQGNIRHCSLIRQPRYLRRVHHYYLWVGEVPGFRWRKETVEKPWTERAGFVGRPLSSLHIINYIIISICTKRVSSGRRINKRSK